MKQQRLAMLGVIVAVVIGAGSVCAASLAGQPAPDLRVQALTGQDLDLAKLRGQVVVIHFWATWCPPCRAEMPMLDSVYQRYRQQGLAMIALSVDRRHDRDTAVKAAQAFSYPAAMLSEAQTNGFGLPSSLPLTFVIDRAGIVRYEFTEAGGGLTEAALTAAITGLLPAQPARKQ